MLFSSKFIIVKLLLKQYTKRFINAFNQSCYFAPLSVHFHRICEKLFSELRSSPFDKINWVCNLEREF